MNENEINRMTEDTLNSINNLKRSFPDDLLFHRIVRGINDNKNSILKEYSYTGKYAMALAVLVLINIFSFFSYKNTEKNKAFNNSQKYSTTVNDFAKEFFSDQDEYNYNSK